MSERVTLTVWLSGSLKATTKLWLCKSLKTARFAWESFKQIHKKFMNWFEYRSFKNRMYWIVFPGSVLSLLVRSVYCNCEAISISTFSECKRQQIFCLSTSLCPFYENKYLTASYKRLVCSKFYRQPMEHSSKINPILKISYEISSSKLSGRSMEFFMNLYWVALKSKILGLLKQNTWPCC